MRPWVGVVWGWACSPSEPDDDADVPEGDTDTDTDSDADTDSDVDTDVAVTRPTSLGIVCAPDVNELEVWCDVTVEPAQPVQITSARTDGVGVSRVTTSDGMSGTHHVPVLFLGPERAYTFD